MGRLYRLMPWQSSFPCHPNVLWTRQSPVVYFICLPGLLSRLRLAMNDRHVSIFHAKKNHNSCSHSSAAQYILRTITSHYT